jgi:ATP:ADP antiporter, AAA family
VTDFLQRFFNVRRDEILPILIAAFYFFCILTALAMLRPARDALGMQRGIEEIRWLFMGTLVITLFINPLFAFLVSRFRRLVFISASHAFFIVVLVVFCIVLVTAPQAISERTGQVFYVWQAVFNLFMTMIFWALMADRFSFAQSKRFFAVIAVGGTLGAIYGAAMAWGLAEVVGTPMLLLIAAGFVLLATVAAWCVALFRPEQRAADDPEAPPVVNEHSVIGGSALQGLRSVLRSPYLLGMSSYILILTVMATFIYFTRLQMVAAVGDDLDMRTGLLAQIDTLTQTATLVIQVLIAGHLMRRFGVQVALALLPVVAVVGFAGLAIVGTFAALILFDATFRAVQRGIMRPAYHTLWTVVSREDKYKAKAFVDTFVYRTGDVVGAQTEGGLARLGMGLYALAAVALPLAAVWAVLGYWLGRHQARLAEQGHGPAEGMVADQAAPRGEAAAEA